MLSPKSIDDIFSSKVPSLVTISKVSGESVARAAVAFLLSETLEFFSVKETMSDVQIAVTCDLILEEYPYLQLDDLKLCFRNAMKMRYGEVYNRIDGQVILKWLKQYNNERCTEADRISYNEHRKHLADIGKPVEGIYYADYVQELKRRAALGDENAKKSLELSNSIQELLKSQKWAKNDKSENALGNERPGEETEN